MPRGHRGRAKLAGGALFVFLASAPPLFATTTFDPRTAGFEESRGNKDANPAYEKFQEELGKQDKAGLKPGDIIGVSHKIYRKYDMRVRPPGFISATQIPELATIVGPIQTMMYVPGQTVFLRWAGAPSPRPGDRYSTYTPAIVLQSLLDPTEFEIFNMPRNLDDLPKDRRLAGYFYETSGRLRIVRVNQGLVEAMIEQVTGQIQSKDEVMQTPPLVETLTPISSGLQLSAAIVSGSPHDRLSTTTRSFIYLNRGTRDGVRVGRVFEAIETVPLDSSVAAAAPEISRGEAIVVYATDSYSTAIITKEFDLIRIGSLLRSKQDTMKITRSSSYADFDNSKKAKNKEEEKPEATEVPNLENPETQTDETLPEPTKQKKAAAPAPQTKQTTPTSDLDLLEQQLQMRDLSPEEKAKLNKLSRQEKLDNESDNQDDTTPGVPATDSSFAKKPAKKDATKKKTTKDEEELNLLMMQN